MNRRDLKAMAAAEPLALLSLISSGTLSPSDLAYAAEYAGYIDDTEAVVAALLPLLASESPLVREGAVYGLERHMGDAVRERLIAVAHNDPSPGVRGAAKDALS